MSRPLRLTLWLLALLALAWVLRSAPLRQIVAVLGGLTWQQMGVLAVVNALILLLLSGRWWAALWALGCRVSYLSLSGYRLAAFSVTYFTPGPQFGGEPVQIALVRQRHGAATATATAAVVIDKSLELLVNFGFLFLGVIVVLRLGLPWPLGRVTLLGLSLGLLFLPLGYLSALVLGLRPLSRLLDRRPLAARSLRFRRLLALSQAAESQVGEFCRQRPAALALALIFSLATWAAMIGEYWLAARFLGLDWMLPEAIAALTAARFAYLLPLPGGLGALEASQAFAAAALGDDPAAGATLALLIRGRDVLTALVGLWLGARYRR
jgi:hypothetical protein